MGMSQDWQYESGEAGAGRMIWETLKRFLSDVWDIVDSIIGQFQRSSPFGFKLAVIALIVFLLVWVIALRSRARESDLERRAQQMRAQAAERNGLKLAPLGDNSMPDPRHGKDNLWRNFALLVGLVLILGFTLHRYGGKGGYAGPRYGGPVYAGPAYEPPGYANSYPAPAYPTYPIQRETIYLPEPTPPPHSRPIQPTSQRTLETRASPAAVSVGAAAMGAAPLNCVGEKVRTGSAEFFVRTQSAAIPAGAGPEAYWGGFNRATAAEARRFYETQDRPAMIAQYGARSPAVAYNANNLAVAMLHIGDCGGAEAWFKEARALAKDLNLPFVDQMKIDQNYAHFRALRGARG